MKTSETEHNSISRADFLGAGAAAFVSISVIGCIMGCANKSEDSSSSGGAKNFSGTLTLTTDQKTTLDAQNYLNLDGLIVLSDAGTYRAFGRRCPHEAGQITAQSGTSLQCQNHTDQFYNKLGQGNGARTTASLTSYTVSTSPGPLTITG
jgi:nitrite reductase/ring-hydroxylating ferredoxin subunit